MATQKDVVIVHGMFSCSLAMRHLERALENRGIYRKIHLLDLKSPSHRQVPMVYANKNAALIAHELDRKISTKSLLKKFDVIGHSNGGYVALFLQHHMTKGNIDLTFTVASPKGFSLLNQIDIPHDRRSKVFHFRGGVDGVPFGYQHNPGDGHWVLTFPDEGHSSIHLDSDKNGLADFIALINGKRKPYQFVDTDKVIHLWPFCKTEIGEGNILQKPFQESGGFTICAGIHDAKLETLKAEKEYWDTALIASQGASPAIGAYAIARLRRYIRIRSRLDEKLVRADQSMAKAKLYGKVLRDELASLEAVRDNLIKKIKGVERRVDLFYSAARKRHKLKLERAMHPLNMAWAISASSNAINEEVLISLTALLKDSDQEFSKYFDDQTVRTIEQG